MKLVIIEDEKLTSEDLAETVLQIDPKITIVGILSSVKEAIGWFNENESPDLIMSDIQLGDGLSFEIFKAVNCTVPVIFCTAFDMYAINAFKANGIDYILKPFTVQSIAEALTKYSAFKQNFTKDNTGFETIIDLFTKQRQTKSGSILVYHKDKIIPIKLESIALFYIGYEITHLITFDNKSYSISKSLEELESISNSQFYRVNRQYLVNRKSITEASTYFARKLSLTLSIPFKETITVSKEKVSTFLLWLSEN
jgi:DNA-binding LytR/AlgR family response regulator